MKEPESKLLNRLGQRWRELLGTYRWALIVVAVGALLMALPTGSGRNAGEASAEVSAGAAEDFDLEGFETRLAEALSRVEGAGETRVVLTLDGGARSVLARDSQTDGDGSGSAAVPYTLTVRMKRYSAAVSSAAVNRPRHPSSRLRCRAMAVKMFR